MSRKLIELHYIELKLDTLALALTLPIQNQMYAIFEETMLSRLPVDIMYERITLSPSIRA